MEAERNRRHQGEESLPCELQMVSPSAVYDYAS